MTSLTPVTRSVGTQTVSLETSSSQQQSINISKKSSSASGLNEEKVDNFEDMFQMDSARLRQERKAALLMPDSFADDMLSVESLDISGRSVVSLTAAASKSMGSTTSSSQNRVTVAHSENAKDAKKKHLAAKSIPRKLYSTVKSPASPVHKDITMSLVGLSIHSTLSSNTVKRSPSIPGLYKALSKSSTRGTMDDVDTPTAEMRFMDHDEDDVASGIVSPSSSISMSPRLMALDTADDLSSNS